MRIPCLLALLAISSLYPDAVKASVSDLSDQSTLLRSDTNTVLVEAEGFDSPGGWVIDQQFMDQMGSPFLMAHGLGVPCADATANVEFPETGRWHVWVRTRNWVSNWDSEEGPGQFQLVVNGKLLDTVFGKSGGAWHWQAGGSIEIENHHASLALHDLTGFNGRCDAIVFAKDPDFHTPNGRETLAAFRKPALGLTAAIGPGLRKLMARIESQPYFDRTYPEHWR